MMTATTALYRFYGAGDELLYIGITNSIPRRLDQHSDSKPWYVEATRIDVRHFPTRSAALAAEMAAIKAEHPKYNIVHNRDRAARAARHKGPRGPWVFESRRSGYERQIDLHLYPEIDCTSVVDDACGLDGEGQLAYYVEYLEANYPQWLADDAVPIAWFVESRDASICEAAPFGPVLYPMNFLTHFTWPYHAETLEQVDWFRLPILNLRFPEFAEALGWTPSPLQPTCPLRSILASRDGIEIVRRPGAGS